MTPDYMRGFLAGVLCLLGAQVLAVCLVMACDSLVRGKALSKALGKLAESRGVETPRRVGG